MSKKRSLIHIPIPILPEVLQTLQDDMKESLDNKEHWKVLLEMLCNNSTILTAEYTNTIFNNLLDIYQDNDTKVKDKKVKSDKVKSNEVKSDEVKSDEEVNKFKRQKIHILQTFLLKYEVYNFASKLNNLCKNQIPTPNQIPTSTCVLSEDFYDKLEDLTLLDGRLDEFDAAYKMNDDAYKMNGGGFQTGGVIDDVAMAQIKKILNFQFLDTDCLKSLYDRIMIKAFDYLKFFIETSFEAFELLIIGYDKSTKNVKDDLIVDNAEAIIYYAEQYAEFLVGQDNKTYIEKIGNIFEYLLFNSKISEAVQGVGAVGEGLILIITKIFNLILITPSLLNNLQNSINDKSKEYYDVLIQDNKANINKLYIGSMCAYISYINNNLINKGLMFSGQIVGQMITTAWNYKVAIVYFTFMAAVGKLLLNIIHQGINKTVKIGADTLTEKVTNLKEFMNTPLLNKDTQASIEKLVTALEPFKSKIIDVNVFITDFITELDYLSKTYLDQLGGISKDEQLKINEVVNQQINNVIIPQINEVVIPQIQALIEENNNNMDLGGRASTRKRRKLATSRKKSNRGRKPKTAKKGKTRRRNP